MNDWKPSLEEVLICLLDGVSALARYLSNSLRDRIAEKQTEEEPDDQEGGADDEQ